jgi:ribose transport system permease protein
MVVVIVGLAVIFQLRNSVFLSSGNVVEVLRSGVLYFMVACPSTLVLVGGGLDFSVGSLYAAGGVFGCGLMVLGVPWPAAMLLGVGAGALLGGVNAFVAIRFKVPPLIATLGMFYAAGGLITVITSGNDVFNLPASFLVIGQGSVLGVPYLVLYGVAAGVVFHVLLERTKYGYAVKATGGNRAAASANGIQVKRVDFMLYSVSGAMAALAGILYAARTGAASPQSGGASLTFEVVTAIIIGGTSLFGGVGTVLGSAFGCLLFAETENGLAIINVNPLYQEIFVGVILVGAVAIDQARRGRRFRLGRT